MEKLWLLTSGSGADGDEWELLSIHSSEEKATEAKEYYERPRKRVDGSTYHYDASIEEWELDPE